MREVWEAPRATGGESVNLADVVWNNADGTPTDIQFVQSPAVTAGLRGESAGASPDGIPVTCRQFRDHVVAVARGLVAARVSPGDRVALLSSTRYEWTVFDYAIWSVGAVTVPVYETSSAEQVGWILENAGAVACLVETADHARMVEQARAHLPRLRTVWQIECGGVDRLIDSGRAVDPDLVRARRAATGGDDLATIIYTSGTTGRPKGCMLSHRNIHQDVANAVAALPDLFHPGGRTVLFLPLAHAFARLIQVGVVQARVVLVHHADARGVLDRLREFRPTFILAVPRVFEKVYNRTKQKAQDERKSRQFSWAERVAIRHSRARDRRRGPTIGLTVLHAIFDVLVYRRLRATLGGRCRVAIVGGAPLGERLGHFFRGVGITVLEGYGLTETSPALTVNRSDANRIGTVGRPLPGIRIAVADDGEVLARGDTVFPGYWSMPEETAEAFTPDGWLRTGDLGQLDDDGFLTITGRKKEIIVTAGGKNVAPSPLEDRVRAHPLVSQCLLLGDDRPFIAALVTIDGEGFARWRSARGFPAATTVADLTDDQVLRGEVQKAVDEANGSVSRPEEIKEFRILAHDFTEERGELTPTLKVRRDVVQRRQHRLVDEIYGAG